MGKGRCAINGPGKPQGYNQALEHERAANAWQLELREILYREVGKLE
jgi:hypothetical protein